MTETNEPSTSTGFVFGENIYNKLKFVALILLPALSTLYFMLAAALGLPYVEQVLGTIAAIDTFLGAILGLSTKAYNASDAKFAGDLVIRPGEEGKTNYTLALNNNPEEFSSKKEIIFKVDNPGGL